MKTGELYDVLGLNEAELTGGGLAVHSPIDGAEMARIKTDTSSSLNDKIARAETAFKEWRMVPPPRRGELIRLFGNELRAPSASKALRAMKRAKPG